MFDLAFIVDSSGSISRKNFARMKQFLKLVVSEFNIGPEGTHVAVVVYSTNAQVVHTFNVPRGQQLTAERVTSNIDALPHLRGLTFIDKALRLAENNVFVEASGMRRNALKVFCSNSTVNPRE